MLQDSPLLLQVSEDPVILAMDSFLTPQECQVGGHTRLGGCGRAHTCESGRCCTHMWGRPGVTHTCEEGQASHSHM